MEMALAMAMSMAMDMAMDMAMALDMSMAMAMANYWMGGFCVLWVVSLVLLDSGIL